MAELTIDLTETWVRLLKELDELYTVIYQESSLLESQWLNKKREAEDLERKVKPLLYKLETISNLRETLRSLIDKEGQVK
jgi:hypothetical protein